MLWSPLFCISYKQDSVFAEVSLTKGVEPALTVKLRKSQQSQMPAALGSLDLYYSSVCSIIINDLSVDPENVGSPEYFYHSRWPVNDDDGDLFKLASALESFEITKTDKNEIINI